MSITSNNIDECSTITIGTRENPILALFDRGMKGRIEMILSGHCPDCGKTFVGHSCSHCPPESFQIQ